MKAKNFYVVVGLIFCFWGVWISGRAGLSRYLISEGTDGEETRHIEAALRLTPSDPEAHSALAFSLWRQGKFPDAVKKFQRMVELRPRDYVAWSYLGEAKKNAGDESGALEAYQKAVELAPHYAQPHWDLGKQLLHVGRVNDAFAELRRAADSEPSLRDELIDLAFERAQGNAELVLGAVVPSNDETRIALSHVFLDKFYPSEAVALFNTTEVIPKTESQRFISALLDAGYFEEASAQWAKGGAGRQSFGGADVKIFDPGFELLTDLSEAGFGWQSSNKLGAVGISLDRTNPHGGAHSLRFDFSGNSDPSLAVISQLLLIKPNKAYRLTFASRSEKLVSGGPPQMLVSDAGHHQLLGPAAILPLGTREWSNYKIDFRTGADTRAVKLILQRQMCSSSPCPAFGSLWLDDLNVELR